jgi:hypothetical protein
VVAWDGYVDVRGNRYSVPSEFSGRTVEIRVTLDGRLKVLSGDEVVIEHALQPRSHGWVTVAAHHDALWKETLRVERRDLSVYEEVARCS